MVNLNLEEKKSTKKRILAEAAIAVVFLAFSCLIIMPSIVKCIENKSMQKCEYHIYEMLHVIEDKIDTENTDIDAHWHDLIKYEEFDELIEEVSDIVGDDKYPASDYYAYSDGNQLTIGCRKHSDSSRKSIKL